MTVLAFTVGGGNEVQIAGIGALASLVVGRPVDDLLDDVGGLLLRRPAGDSQLRWLGPDKGVIHMAASAVLNAFWDLACRAAGKPLWRLLAELSPEQAVSLVDFRYRLTKLKVGAQMHPDSVAAFTFPDGPQWKALRS